MPPVPATHRMTPLARLLLDAIGQSLRGKEDAIELALIALFAGGHVLIEDQPGVGKTLLGQEPGPVARPAVPARAVHRRPAAERHRRRAGLPAEDRRTDVPAGPGVHVGAARRRTQPHAAAHPVGAARVHGRAARDHRSHVARAARAVLRDRDAEPADRGRHLPAAGEPARSLPAVPAHRPPGPRARDRGRGRARTATGSPRACGRWRAATTCWRREPAVDVVRCDRELAAFMVALAGHTRRAPDAVQGVSTRGAQALHRACRARAFVHGRTYVVPDDVRALLLPVWAHRLGTRSGGQHRSAAARSARRDPDAGLTGRVRNGRTREHARADPTRPRGRVAGGPGGRRRLARRRPERAPRRGPAGGPLLLDLLLQAAPPAGHRTAPRRRGAAPRECRSSRR
jgi:MoxR-like ATPase